MGTKVLTAAQRSAARANIKKANEQRRKDKRAPTPSLYDPRFDLIAYKLGLLGYTLVEIGEALGVSNVTIDTWMEKHSSFKDAVLLSRDRADSAVADSLYRRATGYEYNTTKIVVDAKTGMTTQIPYVEHVPPDPACMIFWLKNRQRDRWRDRVEQKIDAKVEATVTQTDYAALRKLLTAAGNAG
jgi:hypothetical protein